MYEKQTSIPTVKECFTRLSIIGGISHKLIDDLTHVTRYSDFFTWGVLAHTADGGTWDMEVLRFRPKPPDRVETMGGEVC